MLLSVTAVTEATTTYSIFSAPKPTRTTFERVLFWFLCVAAFNNTVLSPLNFKILFSTLFCSLFTSSERASAVNE